MPIDMHHHWIPKGLSQALRARATAPRLVTGEDGRQRIDCSFSSLAQPEGFDDPQTRLAEMDANGITRGVLSLTPVYGIENLPAQESLPLCRAFNDSVSEMCVTWPDRFSAFAALPCANINVATEEFERAMSLPGMVGALVPGDGFLSAKRAQAFAPLLEAANKRGAILMAHYAKLADDPTAPKPDLSDNHGLRIGTLDMQARLSSNMITFCLTDALKPYPNLTMMSHNLGGNIPYEVERLDHRSYMDRPDDELPSRRIRNAKIMVDCNSLAARGIENAVAVYGADKIVLGTDGTAFGMKWSQDAIREARISDAEKHAILDGNAAALLAPFIAKLSAAAE
jgi:predicted TIM-barrel fold metal-dependent hydrolase